MENKKIKVSVVIPVYNTEKYVREAVESIMNQTLRELEIIIINDGSTDNSLQVVEELAAADSRIQVYSQTNQGGSVARNASRELTENIFILWTVMICWKKKLSICATVNVRKNSLISFSSMQKLSLTATSRMHPH